MSLAIYDVNYLLNRIRIAAHQLGSGGGDADNTDADDDNAPDDGGGALLLERALGAACAVLMSSVDDRLLPDDSSLLRLVRFCIGTTLLSLVVRSSNDTRRPRCALHVPSRHSGLPARWCVCLSSSSSSSLSADSCSKPPTQIGFATRAVAERAVSGRARGTCFVRFAERQCGQFAITYVGSNDDRPRHYLVTDADLTRCVVDRDNGPSF